MENIESTNTFIAVQAEEELARVPISEVIR